MSYTAEQCVVKTFLYIYTLLNEEKGEKREKQSYLLNKWGKIKKGVFVI